MNYIVGLISWTLAVWIYAFIWPKYEAFTLPSMAFNLVGIVLLLSGGYFLFSR